MLKKNEAIEKLKKALKEQEEKAKLEATKVNDKSMNIILKEIEKNEIFKNDFVNLLNKFNLSKVLTELKKVYDIK